MGLTLPAILTCGQMDEWDSIITVCEFYSEMPSDLNQMYEKTFRLGGRGKCVCGGGGGGGGNLSSLIIILVLTKFCS